MITASPKNHRGGDSFLRASPQLVWTVAGVLCLDVEDDQFIPARANASVCKITSFDWWFFARICFRAGFAPGVVHRPLSRHQKPTTKRASCGGAPRYEPHISGFLRSYSFVCRELASCVLSTMDPCHQMQTPVCENQPV